VATTDVDICNLALSIVGVGQRIFALTDGTKEANLCNAFYAHARDVILARHWWGFATKRAALSAAAGEAARTGWANIYGLPADCLEARYIIPTGGRVVPADAKIPFETEAGTTTGRVLLCDKTSAELVYTARISDVPSYSPLFCEALAGFLGAKLVMPLAVQPQFLQIALQLSEGALLTAANQDVRQRQGDTPSEAAAMRARHGLFSAAAQTTPVQSG
jgi:hypothetical protein